MNEEFYKWLDKNFSNWGEMVAKGKATPDRIISMISAKTKLTDDQKDKINSLTQEGKK